jgi:hypothetical protein
MYKEELIRKVSANNRLLQQICSKTADPAIPVEYTTFTAIITGVTEIPAGVLSYSITNTDGVGPWTFNGAAIPANVYSISDYFVGAGVLGTAIPLDAAGNSLLLIYAS